MDEVTGNLIKVKSDASHQKAFYKGMFYSKRLIRQSSVIQDSFALVENSMVRLVRSLNRELDNYKNNN